MRDKHAVIRCPIHGSIHISRRELKIIDSPFFQRLRGVSQLGFTSFVFPGATHTRFAHSAGSMHLAGRVYDQLVDRQFMNELKEYYTPRQLEYFYSILRFSALLHDTGHLPFSHAAEDLFPSLSSLRLPNFIQDAEEGRQADHEDFSRLIIYHLAAEEKLLSKEEAIDIISILSKNLAPSERFNAKNGEPMIYPLLCQLINGEVDVDRMDYLLRDSYFAGVPYGKFDLDRLLDSLSCCLAENINRFLLAIDGEGVPSYEIFLLCRVHMFYQIYFHKSLGAYNYYLKKAFQENEIDIKIDGSPETFLSLNESGLIEKFRENKDKKWCGKIFRREPAKNLIRVLDNEEEGLKKLEKAREILNANGIESILSYSANQYSSQIKNKEIDQETILAIDQELGNINIVPLSRKSSLLWPEEKSIKVTQLYVHRADYEAAISKIAEVLFR